MNQDPQALRDAYLDALRSTGSLTDPQWIKAFGDVPRHLFVPGFFRRTEDGRWHAVDDTAPDYLTQIYSDLTLTTQLDGHLDPDPSRPPVRGVGTSSSTQPSLMAAMLEALGTTGDERILEIGTGTGYNAALLTHRLGDDRVVTVEVDRHLASRARAALARADYHPAVHVDDGQRGWELDAPYDRVIATCSVPRVPYDWITQTTDGGYILASLWRRLGGAPLVRLTVDGRAAHGFFLTTGGGFMPARPHQPTAETDALRAAAEQHGQVRPARHTAEALTTEHAELWAALLVPDASWLGLQPESGGEQLWLFAPDGSWSMLDRQAGTVEEYGPRRLWDEVEQAHDRWLGAGSPERHRLGLSVCGDGRHRFWLDDPDSVVFLDPPEPGRGSSGR